MEILDLEPGDCSPQSFVPSILRDFHQSHLEVAASRPPMDGDHPDLLQVFQSVDLRVYVYLPFFEDVGR